MSSPLRLALAAAGALALSATGAAALVAPAPGTPAPAFVASDAAGKPVSLAAFHGRTVILEWTNEGCPYVRHVYDSGVMQALQRRAEVKGFVWLTVISSAPGKQGYLTPGEVAAWKTRTGAAPADVVLDPKGVVGRAYGATATPTVFIIDPKGLILYAGAIDDHPSAQPQDAMVAKNYLAAAMDDLGAGRPIAVSSSRPYGCSVKYADE
jgi:hypothetical protein